MKKLLFLSLFLLLQQTASALTIIQKPIIFNKARIELTREYQYSHYGITSHSLYIEPKIIVIHWTNTKTLEEAFELFNPPFLHHREELPGKLNVSIHFLIDRDGTIYQLMPDHWMARHVIGLNHYAIGIENVGGVNDKPDLTMAQVKADKELIAYLKNKYPAILYVIGHMDYLKFKKSDLWLEKNDRYRTIKYDPGKNFMKNIKK